MSGASQSIHCPICGINELTSAATAPYARGFILAYQVGAKKFAGCKPCVAKNLRVEALKSVTYGWFSITALFLNLLFIPWNLLQSLFVRENPQAVTRFFDQIGVPQPGTEHRLTEALYAAGAALIHADGRVEGSEIESAKQLGPRILPEFDPIEFDRVVNSNQGIPAIESLGAIFDVYLSPQGKNLVVQYLVEIAIADRNFHKSEDRLIESLAMKMGINKSEYRKYRDSILEEVALN